MPPVSGRKRPTRRPSPAPARRLFGTDGVRGPAGVGRLAPAALARLGTAVARVLAERSDGRPRVLVGRDTRASGAAVSSAFSGGLLTGGADVVDGGVLPTPAVAMLARRRRFDMGVVVSASHNPWRDNGLKLLGADGAKIDDSTEIAIEDAFADEDLDGSVDPEAVGSLETWTGARSAYVESLLRELSTRRLRGLHVVTDVANGAQSGLAARILRRLGARVSPLNERPDGRNINENCGALHTRALARTVRAEGADVGLAFDGDADRLQIVDERGRLRDGDVVLAALAPRLLQARRLPHRTVVGTVMTNAGLAAHLDEHGIALARTAVGDRNIVAEMSARGLGLGGEPSGHLIVPRRGLLTGDALYAAVLCLHVMKSEGCAASELGDGYRPWPLELVSLRIRERTELRRLPRTWAAITSGRETLGTDGRVVVRYSGTEPKVRVMVEARRRKAVKPVLAAVVEALRTELGAR